MQAVERSSKGREQTEEKASKEESKQGRKQRESKQEI
jgi:hypothetical protein